MNEQADCRVDKYGRGGGKWQSRHIKHVQMEIAECNCWWAGNWAACRNFFLLVSQARNGVDSHTLSIQQQQHSFTAQSQERVCDVSENGAAKPRWLLTHESCWTRCSLICCSGWTCRREIARGIPAIRPSRLYMQTWIKPSRGETPVCTLVLYSPPFTCFLFLCAEISENYISQHNKLNINAMILWTSLFYFYLLV